MLGVIADDITGATDLASRLRTAGCRTVLTIGVPSRLFPQAEVVIVATKSRSLPVAAAREQAAAAMDYFESCGADQLFFKYCSTFDSTSEGNIGPVTDLLLERTGTDFAVLCPAYPALGRTLYQGHLFVADRLLSESSMRNHPLTPMSDPDIVRFLRRQTRSAVAAVSLEVVESGPTELLEHLERLRSEGVRMAVVDAVFDRHINIIAAACRGVKVVTGGAALGGALGAERRAFAPANSEYRELTPVSGATAMLSGSCSAASRAQVAHALGHVPSFQLDPFELYECAERRQEVIRWAMEHAQRGDFLIYSTSDADTVAEVQGRIGTDEAAACLDRCFGEIARAVAEVGVRRFVVAGGETSGAVAAALGIQALEIAEDVAAGVPSARSIEPEGYALAFKSGNFGGPDFFLRARETI